MNADINIQDMCHKLDVSRSKLYYIFKNQAGIGIAQYIKNRRLHKAKKLLKTTDLSIVKIAESVGFSDYNYFSRVYKNKYGKSPYKYRKNR